MSAKALAVPPSAIDFTSSTGTETPLPNVDSVTEITNLITAQRAYEMNSRVITTSDDMLSTLTNLK